MARYRACAYLDGSAKHEDTEESFSETETVERDNRSIICARLCCPRSMQVQRRYKASPPVL